MKLGHFKTRTEAINAALAEFVTRNGRLRMLELKGQFDFDPDWDPKRMRRAGRSVFLQIKIELWGLVGSGAFRSIVKGKQMRVGLHIDNTIGDDGRAVHG